MLVRCWATLCDTVTTLLQHSVNVLCLLTLLGIYYGGVKPLNPRSPPPPTAQIWNKKSWQNQLSSGWKIFFSFSSYFSQAKNNFSSNWELKRNQKMFFFWLWWGTFIIPNSMIATFHLNSRCKLTNSQPSKHYVIKYKFVSTWSEPTTSSGWKLLIIVQFESK